MPSCRCSAGPAQNYAEAFGQGGGAGKSAGVFRSAQGPPGRSSFRVKSQPINTQSPLRLPSDMSGRFWREASQGSVAVNLPRAIRKYTVGATSMIAGPKVCTEGFARPRFQSGPAGVSPSCRSRARFSATAARSTTCRPQSQGAGDRERSLASMFRTKKPKTQAVGTRKGSQCTKEGRTRFRSGFLLLRVRNLLALFDRESVHSGRHWQMPNQSNSQICLELIAPSIRVPPAVPSGWT